MPVLSHSTDGALATIVLDNPPQNRLAREFTDELSEAVDAVTRSEARAVLLRAEGPDFSYGGDFLPWVGADRHILRADFDRAMAVVNQFEQLPVPVLAAVQGLCFGGGFELALRADIIIASESARFGHPEQSLGIVTLLGGIYRVAERAGRARAFEWALTSEQVPATVMAEAGVVNRVVPDEVLQTEAEGFARRIAAGPTQAHSVHKALLRAWATGGIPAADQHMFDLAVPLFETEDVKEGLVSAAAALREGRPRPALAFKGR
ncbi:enoyl-CoA hydratase/isomerase family protein [Streptomyces sp. 3214.6]|uniref:enoyl-CoA hydratase/isomerase family protein n=1 Tax=Streptomyces sp. 3214.6 TaxID=1882757 RepID=UPI00090A807C|nr:enoyl-CoA hydratase/isomerase family protein [Streptomyces sp. 3214.6]SHH30457.1 Enoyl-CoA hydratase/carnithine racemase [Streptomyces sp. 3214.6]